MPDAESPTFSGMGWRADSRRRGHRPPMNMKHSTWRLFLHAAAAAVLCSCAGHAPTMDHEEAASAGGPSFSSQEALSWVTYNPQPQYPLEARRLRLMGAGLFQMRVQIRTGLVKEVTVRRSTGWAMLDAAAIRTLKLWRFRPGAPPPIKVIAPHRQDPFAAEDSLMNVPISFSMSDGRGWQGR